MLSFEMHDLQVQLKKRLKPVLSKQRGLALGVWGEAGIGKSYVVKHLLAGLSCQYLKLHASESLASLAKHLPKGHKLPLWAESKLERLVHNEPYSAKDSAFTLSTCLAALAPFVLHLEDIHELEKDRLEFVSELAKQASKNRGVCVLVTSRVQPPPEFLSQRLEPLSHKDMETILNTEMKATLPLEALNWIYGRVAGNPLFSLEFLKYLVRQGFVWNDGKDWHWREPPQDYLPLTIEALIDVQISKAKRQAHMAYVLEVKALLPLGVDDAVVARCARLTGHELELASENLRQWGLFKADTFVHPIFKEVALKSLSPARKRNLSRRIINSLEAKPEAVAQYIDAAELEKPKALALLQRAAANLEPQRKLEAANVLEKAIGYAEGNLKAELSLKAAHLRLETGDANIIELLHFAMAEPETRTEALKALAEAHALRGEQQAFKEIVARISAIEINREWLIRCYFTLGDYSGIIRLVENLDANLVYPNSIYFIAWSFLDKGDLKKALALAENRLTELSLKLGEKAELLDIRASVLHYQGQFQEADKWFSEVIELYQKAGTAWDGVANALRNRALNRLELGQYLSVIPDFQAALNVYAERGAVIFYAQTLVMMSDVYFELGDYLKAEDCLTESLSIFGQVEPQPFYVQALTCLVHLYAEQATALNKNLLSKYAQMSMELAETFQSKLYESMALLAAAESQMVNSEYQLALNASEKALDLSKISGLKALTVKALTSKAKVCLKQGNQSLASTFFQDAYKEAKASGMRLEEYKLGLELDNLNHDIDAARKRLQWFEARGLKNAANLAKRYFPDLAESSKNVSSVKESLGRLEILGKMQVRQGQSVEPIQGSKRRALLLRLLEAKLSGFNEISQLDLVDILYVEKDETSATTALKQLVHQIRSSLGEGFILRTSGGYSLGEVRSDAEDFLNTGDTTLWQGNFQGLNDSRLAESLYQTLKKKALELLNSDQQEAGRVLGLLHNTDPYNLELARLYIAAFQAAMPRQILQRRYKELWHHFSEVGESLPESVEDFLTMKV